MVEALSQKWPCIWNLFRLLATRAAVQVGASCPNDFYRNATVLFSCTPPRSHPRFLLTSQFAEAVSIPKGIENFELHAEAPNELEAIVRDPATGQEVVSSADGTGNWQAAAVELTSSVVPGGFIKTVGLKISLVLSGTLVVELRGSQGSQEQSVANITIDYGEFLGCPATPIGCAAYVGDEVRALVFNWSSWAQSQYNTVEEAWGVLCRTPQEAISNIEPGPVPYCLWGNVWSKWPSASKSNPGWQAAFKFIDNLGGTPEDGYVEHDEFRVAFDLAGLYLSMFNWCETLHETSSTAASAWAAVSGKAAVSGRRIDNSQWKSQVWANYQPKDGFSKPSADAAFAYADVNADNDISETELTEIYNSCGTTSTFFRTGVEVTSTVTTSMHPVGTMTTSSVDFASANQAIDLGPMLGSWLYYDEGPREYQISQSPGHAVIQIGTTFPPEPQYPNGREVLGILGRMPAEDWSTGDGLSQQWLQAELNSTDGALFGHVRLKYIGENDTIVSNFKALGATQWGPELVAHRGYTATSTTLVFSSKASNATAPASSFDFDALDTNISTECCMDMEAKCLACQSNRSIVQVCSTPLMAKLRGCPGATGNTKELGASGRHSAVIPKSANCLYEGAVYAGSMPGAAQSVESSAGKCQERCAQTFGCAHFSFARSGGKCDLFDPNVTWRHEPGTVSGPPLCIAEVRLHVSGVEFTQLTDIQQADLVLRLVQDVVVTAGLPVASSVRDTLGKPGSLTLTSGSLLIDGFVDVPPGRSLADLSSSIAGIPMRNRILSSLAGVHAANALKANASLDNLLVEARVGALPLSHCFLLGTKYDPSMPIDQPYADNGRACQARCASTPGCAHFTYWWKNRGCLLQNAAASIVHSEGAMSGPQVCSTLPLVPEPRPGDLIGAEGTAGSATPWGSLTLWLSLLLLALLCIIAVLMLHPFFCNRKSSATRGGLFASIPYQPLSSEVPKSDGPVPASQPLGGRYAVNGGRPHMSSPEPLAPSPAPPPWWQPAVNGGRPHMSSPGPLAPSPAPPPWWQPAGPPPGPLPELPPAQSNAQGDSAPQSQAPAHRSQGSGIFDQVRLRRPSWMPLFLGPAETEPALDDSCSLYSNAYSHRNVARSAEDAATEKPLVPVGSSWVTWAPPPPLLTAPSSTWVYPEYFPMVGLSTSGVLSEGQISTLATPRSPMAAPVFKFPTAAMPMSLAWSPAAVPVHSPSSLFDRIDQNQDGVITRAEFSEWEAGLYATDAWY